MDSPCWPLLTFRRGEQFSRQPTPALVTFAPKSINHQALTRNIRPREHLGVSQRK
jgi:hypothetical protein